MSQYVFASASRSVRRTISALRRVHSASFSIIPNDSQTSLHTGGNWVAKASINSYYRHEK